MTRIEAWDAEDVAIVWGTHDRATAVEAYHAYLVNDCGFDPAIDDEVFPTDPEQLWDGARAEYADPVVRTQNEEEWADDQYSAEPVEGWVPFLIVGLW